MTEEDYASLIAEAAESMLEPLALMTAVRDEDGNVVDLQWRFINSSGTEQLLLPADELIGKRLLQVLPEHGNGLFDKYREVIETGEPFIAHELGYSDDWGTGELIQRIFNIRATRCGDGVAISWTDVTESIAIRHELRAKNRELQAAQIRFEETTKKAPIGHAVLNMNGTFMEVNNAYCVITGYSHQELMELTFRGITHPDDLPMDEVKTNELRRGKINAYSLDKRYIKKDGQPIWVKLFVSLIRDEYGEPSHYIAQAIDIDLQKRAESAAEAALNHLKYRSTHDALTELPNREEFVRALQLALQDDQTRNRTSVLFIDIDHFKEVNDGMSHSTGDAILTAVGHRIAECVGADQLVGRLGGDEFAVVTTKPRTARDLEILAERIRSGVANSRFNVVGAQLHITVSIGISQSQPSSTPQSLLSEADLALYRAKELGRNRWQIADRQMLAKAQIRLSMIDQMHTGIAHNAFHAWYQPVVDIASATAVGYEALARWERENGRVIPAADFIELAEDSGLIHGIGATVISEAIEQLSLLPSDQMLAVNASPHQLQAPTFATRVLTALSATGAKASQLALEITEQALLKAGTASESNLAALHQAGVKLYVDDFGVGYSSIAILRDYPIDGIKLDRSFSVEYRNNTHSKASLVTGLSQLAGHLGLDRIAEGIETEEQLDYLHHAGWTKGQGYLFGQAVPDPLAIKVSRTAG